MHVTATWLADPPLLDAALAHTAWATAPAVVLDRLWNGQAAPPEVHTEARVLWTASHLWFGFAGGYADLDVDPDAEVDTRVERVGLWDRDVCEAFVQSPHEPHAASYKELEVAPTAQWCDLAIHQPRVDVDWQWNSGMETAAAIDLATRRFRAVMRVPWAAFGAAPATGDRWRINLFRIARVAGERQYLAYSPTGTSAPDFHVPACFVPLEFLGA